MNDQTPKIKINPNGFVYVCIFSNGLVKVGLSKRDPESRVKAHESSQATSENKLSYSWISPAHAMFRENEARLISFIRPNLILGCKEWAKGVDCPSLMRFSKELDFSVGDHFDAPEYEAESINKAFGLRVDPVWLGNLRLSQLCHNFIEMNGISIDFLSRVDGFESSLFELVIGSYFHEINDYDHVNDIVVSFISGGSTPDAAIELFYEAFYYIKPSFDAARGEL